MSTSTMDTEIVAPSGRVFTSTLLDQIAEAVWQRFQAKAGQDELLDLHFADFPVGKNLRDPIVTSEKIAWYVARGFTANMARLLVRSDISPQFLYTATPEQIIGRKGIGVNSLKEILERRKQLAPQVWIKQQLLSLAAR